MLPEGLIVSCQSERGSAFRNNESILSFAKEVQRGGAVGLRIRDPENVSIVKSNIALPIIGLTKSNYKKSLMLLNF